MSRAMENWPQHLREKPEEGCVPLTQSLMSAKVVITFFVSYLPPCFGSIHFMDEEMKAQEEVSFYH